MAMDSNKHLPAGINAALPLIVDDAADPTVFDRCTRVEQAARAARLAQIRADHRRTTA